MEAQAVPREAATGSTVLLAPRLLRAATDTRLVTLVRQGHRAAFEAIYDRYNRPIHSFCRHMLGDPDEAADAVQHTFMAAYTAIITSDKPLLLRAWLFTIARNRCYSVLRARREQPTGDLVEPVTEGLATQVQRREDLRQLLVDMRELPDDQRSALILAELGTLSHSEIASALGVPATKVKALVFQARESLLASRAARDTDCAEIRRELANARGAALRRANLRRHLRQCQGCREYRRAVERQRRSLAAIIPVATPAALREAVLGATSGGGAATGLAGGGWLASSALKGFALKALVGGTLALLGTAGALLAIHAFGSHNGSVAAARADTRSAASGGSTSAVRVAAHRSLTHHKRHRTHRIRNRHAVGAPRDRFVVSAVLGTHAVRFRKEGAAVVFRRPRRRRARQPAPAPPTSTPIQPQQSDGAQQGGSSGQQGNDGGGQGNSDHPEGNAYGHDPGHDPGHTPGHDPGHG